MSSNNKFTEILKYKDSLVCTRIISFKHIPQEFQKRCYCCGEFVNNCKAILLINNYAYFPNMMMHKDCFVQHDPNELFEQLEHDYNTYKKLHEIFK